MACLKFAPVITPIATPDFGLRAIRKPYARHVSLSYTSVRWHMAYGAPRGGIRTLRGPAMPLARVVVTVPSGWPMVRRKAVLERYAAQGTDTCVGTAAPD
eukprot:228071-Prymnesium_polylepis.1